MTGLAFKASFCEALKIFNNDPTGSRDTEGFNALRRLMDEEKKHLRTALYKRQPGEPSTRRGEIAYLSYNWVRTGRLWTQSGHVAGCTARTVSESVLFAVVVAVAIVNMTEPPPPAPSHGEDAKEEDLLIPLYEEMTGMTIEVKKNFVFPCSNPCSIQR